MFVVALQLAVLQLACIFGTAQDQADRSPAAGILRPLSATRRNRAWEADGLLDLMVISDGLAYATLFAALEEAARRLGRPVNPTVYSGAEFAHRARKQNAFVMRVLAQPKIWVIGSADDLTP